MTSFCLPLKPINCNGARAMTTFHSTKQDQDGTNSLIIYDPGFHSSSGFIALCLDQLGCSAV